MNEKRCTKCKVVKSCDEFYKDEKHRDGLASWCKSCSKTGAAQSKIDKILAENPVSTEALESQENLNKKKLCEAGICPNCKRPNLTNRFWRRPDDNIAYICSWCEINYDKNGILMK